MILTKKKKNKRLNMNVTMIAAVIGALRTKADSRD